MRVSKVRLGVYVVLAAAGLATGWLWWTAEGLPGGGVSLSESEVAVSAEPLAVLAEVELVKVWEGEGCQVTVLREREEGVLWIGCRDGRLWEWRRAGGERLLMDLRGVVSDAGQEQGLLDVLGYEECGQALLYYTDLEGTVRVEVAEVSAEGVERTGRLVLSVEQPYANHNGGSMQWGPDDGLLYVSVGDGGSAGDPGNVSQRDDSPLGKVHRVPMSCSFDDQRLNATEYVWAKGVRNPWRTQFGLDGRLWIADVGQNRWEEISVVDVGAEGPNLGWDVMEGSTCFEPGVGCETEGLVMPVYTYAHGPACSITGGVWYSGLGGGMCYLFADFCTGRVECLGEGSGGEWSAEVLFETHWLVSTFASGTGGGAWLGLLSGQVYWLPPHGVIEQ
jgi:glucose/arabinose dehydrogenase